MLSCLYQWLCKPNDWNTSNSHLSFFPLPERFLESPWIAYVSQMSHIPMKMSKEENRDWLNTQVVMGESFKYRLEYQQLILLEYLSEANASRATVWGRYSNTADFTYGKTEAWGMQRFNHITPKLGNVYLWSLTIQPSSALNQGLVKWNPEVRSGLHYCDSSQSHFTRFS